MTRRDLQAAAKKSGGPWDGAKAFDQSAPIGEITPAAEIPLSTLEAGRLRTAVNNEPRQDAALSEMIWSVPEILIALSRLFELRAGDLVFTGTPAGVGTLSTGDSIEISVDGLSKLVFSIGAQSGNS